jgi:hypothetical protein
MNVAVTSEAGHNLEQVKKVLIFKSHEASYKFLIIAEINDSVFINSNRSFKINRHLFCTFSNSLVNRQLQRLTKFNYFKSCVLPVLTLNM